MYGCDQQAEGEGLCGAGHCGGGCVNALDDVGEREFLDDALATFQRERCREP
jgi:hypothetical protein